MFTTWNKALFCKIAKGVIRRYKGTKMGANLYNRIDTFVFFDLETTDLIRGSKMPKITELSMLAVNRNSIRSDKRNKLVLPRIIHKLTIPICPKCPIQPQASYASNLWNDTLDDIKPFDESTYDMILQFIKRLPGLICFVAHNGNRFDYPVFLSEIEQLKKTFPDNILCVDSLLAFQEFYSDLELAAQPPAPIIPEGHDEVDEEELEKLKNKQVSDTSLDDKWNDTLCSVLDELEKIESREARNTRIMELTSEMGTDVLDAITNVNQQTGGGASNITPKGSPKSMQAINEKTPENQIIRNSCTIVAPKSEKILSKARKSLNFDESKPKNFKLCTIYEHMIGSEAENLHCAEGDCISLLRCICQMGPHFAEWADDNACSLILFKKPANAPRS